MEVFCYERKIEQKERKRKQNTQQILSVIPDLNVIPMDLAEGIPISPDGMPPQKKGKNESVTAEPSSNGKVEINEDPRGSLVLNFVTGSTPPLKKNLFEKFSRYGLLKESEIQFMDDSIVQIVYERSADAQFAFRSLRKSSPFGEALTDFKLHSMETTQQKIDFQMPQPISAVELRKHKAKPVERADLAAMRQNVEMMKLTLERSGHTISPDMKAKLDSEIKGFLDKYMSDVGSSSSSSS